MSELFDTGKNKMTPFAQSRQACNHPTEFYYWYFNELICQYCGAVLEEDEDCV